ncbi:MAG: transglycosylase SLT domain-containing protein [Leptolyngbya sp.]|nr:transglycosylase SLT domain-containing protein [Leptolyngbya sp.]
MNERVRKWLPIAAIAGVSALGMGMVWAVVETVGQRPDGPAVEAEGAAPSAASPVLALALQEPQQRAQQLAALAQGRPSPDQYRARYLLAVDLINQNAGGQALPLLADLEADYPPLAPQVLVKRGQAQKAAGQSDAAIATWQTVVSNHGDTAAAGEALYQLGQTQPAAWDQLLADFPAHPRSVEVAYKRLVETPDRPDAKALLLLMTCYGIEHPEMVALVDRLVADYGGELTPEDWQAVGFAYWERQVYLGAGKAYGQAPASPQTLYRAARGLQIGGERAAAIAGYQRLMATFPEAPETAEGMLKLSFLVDETTALGLLDQVVATFPDRAGEALLEKMDLLTDLDSPDAAAQTRTTLFTTHSQSEAAADLRFRYARQAGQAGDWTGAIAWSEQIVDQNPDSDVAAEATFWAGKWQLRAGQSAAAQAHFERVLRDYPESYFAWRSAVALGWEVGDFQTVRSLQPAVVLPSQRQPLPAGSETVQELYQLGQEQDAWAAWQTEFRDRETPTVEAQFTDGVLRLGVGDNLDGIYMVSSLAWRDEPADQAAYADLQQHPAYGQALYPFPFAAAIARWAAQRQLNPLLVTALIRQESRFEPTIRSVVGAAGLMQVMPSTADWIQSQTDITITSLDNPEDNLNLGTWYLDYTHREYDNNSLYAVASYNAGPGNVADWIDRDNYRDADDFVDRIPFPETKDYVKSVFGGYWNYLRLYNPDIAQRLTRHRANAS